MRINVYIFLLALALSACGGGGGAGSGPASGGTDNGLSPVVANVSAKPLADNKVELSLSGTGQASRFCIRQNSSSVAPLPADSCFTDADSQLLVQQKTLATPSASQRATFTAWLLTGNTVSLHGRVSAPGKTCSQAAYTASSASTLPTVCIITDAGESVLALEPVKAPISVGNFLRYVNQGFYDQTVFHRFLKGSTNVVQGGGYTYSNGSTDPYVTKASTQTTFKLEDTLDSGLSNTAGSIAMARTNEPDSATAGFFVNTTDNGQSGPFDSSNSRNGYAVFGSFVHGFGTWTSLLNSVPGSGQIVFPTTPIALQWVYQIK